MSGPFQDYNPATPITAAWLNGVDAIINGVSGLSSPNGAGIIGYGSTTLDQIFKNSTVFVATSVAALRAIDKTRFTKALATGYYDSGDGGGGTYYMDAADTSSVDNGGTIIVASDGGRWKLLPGRTISPKQFGAKGDGATDDAVALQATVTWAFQSGNWQQIDLANGTFLTNSPIVYPAGGFVILSGGTIKAGGSFPLSRYVIEVTSQSGGLVNHDLRFVDLTIDGAHRGGCLQIDNYIRIVIDRVNFLHFPTQGLWLRKTIDSHECMVTKCFAFEYLFGETGYLTPTPTSVGFWVDSFDNHLISVVCYYTGVGIVVNGQYNLIHQAHVGGATWAIRVTQLAAFTSIVQPYIDSAAVSWENPWNSEIIGGKFLHDTADATFTFIVLKPLSAGLAISGLKVMNCSFQNNGAALVDCIKTDTSAGSFNAGQIINCHMYGNSWANCKQRGTRVRKSLFQTASTVWTFDFTDDLAFGVVQWLQDSFYDATGGAPVSRVTNISGNVVTVTNSVAGNGTVFVEVDVNTGVA